MSDFTTTRKSTLDIARREVYRLYAEFLSVQEINRRHYIAIDVAVTTAHDLIRTALLASLGWTPEEYDAAMDVAREEYFAELDRAEPVVPPVLLNVIHDDGPEPDDDEAAPEDPHEEYW